MPPTQPATTSQQALGNLQSFQSSMKSPDQFLSQAQQGLGVPGMQGQVSGLRQAITNTTNLLNNVAPSVMGRTQNSLVTSAQANRQIANEQAPINQQLKQQESDFSGANADLSRGLSMADQQANMGIQGQNAQLSALDSIYKNLAGQEQNALTNQMNQQKLDMQSKSLDQQNATNKYLADLLSGGGDSKNTPQNPFQTLTGMQGVTAKQSGSGAGGFNFNFGGSPVSAATFAKMNNINPADLLYNMAQSGDQYSAQAYRDIVNNGGQITPQLMNKYSALFWGEIPSQSKAPARNTVQPSNPFSIGDFSMMSPGAFAL